MKKICFINPNSIFGDIGGAEVQIYLLAMQMVKRNWKVYYITGLDQVPEKNETGIQFIPIHETGDIQKDASLFKVELNEIKPDYIYVRGRKLWTHYAANYSRGTGCKFIFASSMDIDCYKRKFLFRTPNTLRELYARIMKFKYNLRLDNITLSAIKSADLILTQTNTQKKLFKKNLDIDSKVFPNIHALSKQTPSTNKNSKPVVLWLARVIPWKQPELFLKLAEACKHLDCKFVMAGRLSYWKYETKLKEAQEKLPNFEYIGSLSFNDTNELLGKVDLLINTSKQEEGFPNTYVQAWLREVPVITLNFDPDDVIKKHQLGAIAHNFKNLFELTKKFIENTDYREQTGKNASIYARKKHSIEENIDRFLELVETG